MNDSNHNTIETTTQNNTDTYQAEAHEKESTENNADVNNTEKHRNDTETTENKETQSDQTLPEMKVHFIDVGQADAALIEAGRFNLLIDSGDWLGNETVDYLHKRGISGLDLIVGSHPHADHIGQISKIIEQFEVGELWMSGGTTTSTVFEDVMTAVDRYDIDYDEPRAGDHYEIGQMKIDIFSPTQLTGNLNDDSLVMKLTYGSLSFLFTGDAEKNAERIMLENDYPLQSDILKVGHHGSDTSSTQKFIQHVDPKVAIISVAKKSKYSHPDQSVLDRLNTMNIDLFATKSHGDIIITTNGYDYHIDTAQSGEILAGEDENIEETAKATHTKEQNSSQASENMQPSSDCVDINTASELELQSIIHIGPLRAADLIQLRPYQNIDELSKVKGIAKARLADIKSQNLACVN